jgi:hypothetical protein
MSFVSVDGYDPDGRLSYSLVRLETNDAFRNLLVNSRNNGWQSISVKYGETVKGSAFESGPDGANIWLVTINPNVSMTGSGYQISVEQGIIHEIVHSLFWKPGNKSLGFLFANNRDVEKAVRAISDKIFRDLRITVTVH